MDAGAIFRKIGYLAVANGFFIAIGPGANADVSKVICPNGVTLFRSGSSTEAGVAGSDKDCTTVTKSFSRAALSQRTVTSSDRQTSTTVEVMTSSDGKVTTSVEQRDYMRQRRTRAGIAKIPYCEFAGLARGGERQRMIFQILDDDLPVALKQVEIKPNRAATAWRITARGSCSERRVRLAPFRS